MIFLPYNLYSTGHLPPCTSSQSSSLRMERSSLSILLKKKLVGISFSFLKKYFLDEIFKRKQMLGLLQGTDLPSCSPSVLVATSSGPIVINLTMLPCQSWWSRLLRTRLPCRRDPRATVRPGFRSHSPRL